MIREERSHFSQMISRRRQSSGGGGVSLPTPPATLLFDYEPGDVIAGESFTRASVARQKNSSGYWESVAVDTKRDGHYIGGVRHLLLEPQRTNLALYSNDITGAAWSGGATTALNATGIDGVANHATTVTDSNAGGYGSRSQSWNIAADNSSYICSVYIAKDNDESRFPGFAFSLDAISRVFPTINTKTGALGSWLAPVGTGTASVTDDGNFWRLDMRVSNNGTQVSLALDIYPAINDAASGINGAGTASATGSCVIGQVQVTAGTLVTAPIITTSSAVTRAQDVDTQTGFAQQETTFYTKHVHLGSSTSGRIWELGQNNSGVPRVLLYDNGTGFFTLFKQDSSSNITSATPSVGVSPSIGDVLEFRCVHAADGKLSLSYSKNGAAEVVGADSAASTVEATWGASPELALAANTAGTEENIVALAKIKFAAGTKTLAEMRAL